MQLNITIFFNINIKTLKNKMTDFINQLLKLFQKK